MADRQNKTNNRKGFQDPKRFLFIAGVVLVLIIISGGTATMKPLMDYFSEFNEEFAAGQEEAASQEGAAGQEGAASQEETAIQEEAAGQEETVGQEETAGREGNAGQEETDLSEQTGFVSEETEICYEFRKQSYLDQHYEKHGIEMGFASAEEYLAAANAMIAHPDVLTKKEKEDNDDVYFLEATGEFAVVSTDGYLRTYYIADRAYFDRQ